MIINTSGWEKMGNPDKEDKDKRETGSRPEDPERMRQRVEEGRAAIDAVLESSQPAHESVAGPRTNANEESTPSGVMWNNYFAALSLIGRQPLPIELEQAKTLIDKVAQTRDAHLSWIALMRPTELTGPETRQALVDNVVNDGDARFALLSRLNGQGLTEEQKRALEDTVKNSDDEGAKNDYETYKADDKYGLM